MANVAVAGLAIKLLFLGIIQHAVGRSLVAAHRVVASDFNKAFGHGIHEPGETVCLSKHLFQYGHGLL